MTQQYLLEDDEIVLDINILNRDLLSKRAVFNEQNLPLDVWNKIDSSIPNLGYLSKPFQVIHLFAYDLPELVKQAPKAFHTENTLFISKDFWLEMKENLYVEKYSNMKNYLQPKQVVANMLLDLMEHNYQHHFTEEQRLQILNETVASRGESITKSIEKVSFISWEDLYTIAQKSGIKSIHYLEKFTNNTQYFNTALFSTSQLHAEGHPLHKLSDKVLAQQTLQHIDSFEPSIREFKELYDTGFKPEERAYAQHILEHKINQLFEKNRETNSDFFETIQKNITPYLQSVDNKDVICALNFFKKTLAEKELYNQKDEVFIKSLATSLIDVDNEEGFTGYRRTVLSHITGLSEMSSLHDSLKETYKY